MTGSDQSSSYCLPWWEEISQFFTNNERQLLVCSGDVSSFHLAEDLSIIYTRCTLYTDALGWEGAQIAHLIVQILQTVGLHSNLWFTLCTVSLKMFAVLTVGRGHCLCPVMCIEEISFANCVHRRLPAGLGLRAKWSATGHEDTSQVDTNTKIKQTFVSPCFGKTEHISILEKRYKKAADTLAKEEKVNQGGQKSDYGSRSLCWSKAFPLKRFFVAEIFYWLRLRTIGHSHCHRAKVWSHPVQITKQWSWEKSASTCLRLIKLEFEF